MSYLDVVTHFPSKPTYAIRLWAEFQDGDPRWQKPLDSPLYRHIVDYVFEDIWPGLGIEGIMFNEDLAQKIIQEFQQNREGCESLLVHCSRGKNRSPAVAIALNELFDLGHDSERLKLIYRDTNWYVYETLRRVGERFLGKT